MMEFKKAAFCCAIVLVLCGLASVESAAVRQKRQFGSVLTLTGESNARIVNGTIICDTLTCPPESFKCLIVKNSTKDDSNKIEITRECRDPAGKVTAKTVITEPSKFPGQQFESYSEIDKNGNIASFDNRGNTFNHAGEGDIHSYLYQQIEDLHKSILDQLANQGSSFPAA